MTADAPDLDRPGEGGGARLPKAQLRAGDLHDPQRPDDTRNERTEDELASYGPQPSEAERAKALVGGFHVTWLASAILLAAGRLLLVLLVRRRDAEAVAHGEAAAVAV